MCPMCEKRALILEQQQAAGTDESKAAPNRTGGSHSSTGLASYLRNPFKTCKNLSHQCTSPLCESRRISARSARAARRSSVRPSPTPPHSDDLANLREDFGVSESALSSEAAWEAKTQDPAKPADQQQQPSEKKKHTSLLTKLKHLTHHGSASHHAAGKMKEVQLEPSDSEDSSFEACGNKVFAVVHDLEHEEKRRASSGMPALTALYVDDSDDDTISELSLDMTETNVSETTMISMMNLNGSFSSPCVSYHGTLRSSTYDDDASSFAIVPRTSINSSRDDWASDASGLSARFGELDIGYLSLEESGEAPEFDDTVSIASSHPDDLDLNHRPEDGIVSESELDQDYSIDTDSQEWLTETEDAESVLHHFRAHSMDHLHRDLQGTQPVNPSNLTTTSLPRRKHKEPHDPKEESRKPPEIPKITEHICSHCGHKEAQTPQQEQQPTTKKVTRKDNPMSAYFHTYMKGADHAVVAAKVVVLLGKYGNRKGLRVAGLPPPPKDPPSNVDEQELPRLKNMITPSNDAVVAFQNEIATMMLDGVDVPALNMDVEQFLAGYMKLNSPFYIDLIENFFKSVCTDCFGQMHEVQADPFVPEPRRPTSAVIGPKLKSKSTNSRSR